MLKAKDSDSWESQQLFALDFDHNTTIEEQLNRCEALGIMPTFGYTTFSHMKERDEVVNATFDVYDVIQLMVATMKVENLKNYNRKINDYCSKAGINIINNLPDVKLEMKKAPAALYIIL